MARFTQHLVRILATSLLAVGSVMGVVAAESNRYGIPDYPDPQLAAPKAPVAPVVAPRVAPVVAPVTARPKLTSLEPTPTATPTKDTNEQKPAGVSGFFRRMFTFKGSSAAKSAAESPPVSQAPQPQAQVQAQPKPKPQNVATKPVAPISRPAQAQAQISPADATNSESTPVPVAADEAPDPLADAATADSASMKPQVVEETPTPTPTPAPVPAKKPSTLKSWSNRLRWSNFVPVQYGTVPALVAGALPEMRFEAPRGRAPNLPRQSRLDVDQRIERLGPELEPVVNSDPVRGVSFAGSNPSVAGAEDPVISLETLAVLQTKSVSETGKAKSDKIALHTEEIKLIPYENKRGEQFRMVSLFFDPPPPKVSKATTSSSSATYEQK